MMPRFFLIHGNLSPTAGQEKELAAICLLPFAAMQSWPAGAAIPELAAIRVLLFEDQFDQIVDEFGGLFEISGWRGGDGGCDGEVMGRLISSIAAGWQETSVQWVKNVNGRIDELSQANQGVGMLQ
jgi:hypothetical protein